MPRKKTEITALDVSAIILYHGTSSTRYQTIMMENRLRISPITQSVKLSRDPVVATYFARAEGILDNSFPVLIPISVIRFWDKDYDLKRRDSIKTPWDEDHISPAEFYDLKFWEGFRLREEEEEDQDEDRNDWERKISCSQDIFPLSEVLAEPKWGTILEL